MVVAGDAIRASEAVGGALDEGADAGAVRRADGLDGGEGLREGSVFVAARRQVCWNGGAVQGSEQRAGLS